MPLELRSEGKHWQKLDMRHGQKVHSRVFVVVPRSSNPIALLVDAQANVGYLLRESEIPFSMSQLTELFQASDAPDPSQYAAEPGSYDDHFNRLVLVDREAPEGEPPILSSLVNVRESVVGHGDIGMGLSRNFAWD